MAIKEDIKEEREKEARGAKRAHIIATLIKANMTTMRLTLLLGWDLFDVYRLINSDIIIDDSIADELAAVVPNTTKDTWLRLETGFCGSFVFSNLVVEWLSEMLSDSTYHVKLKKRVIDNQNAEILEHKKEIDNQNAEILEHKKEIERLNAYIENSAEFGHPLYKLCSEFIEMMDKRYAKKDTVEKDDDENVDGGY